MPTKLSDYWLNAIMKSSRVKWSQNSVNLLRANLVVLADENESNERKYEKVKDQKSYEGK